MSFTRYYRARNEAAFLRDSANLASSLYVDQHGNNYLSPLKRTITRLLASGELQDAIALEVSQFSDSGETRLHSGSTVYLHKPSSPGVALEFEVFKVLTPLHNAIALVTLRRLY